MAKSGKSASKRDGSGAGRRDAAGASVTAVAAPAPEDEILRLKGELEAARQELRTIREEYEAANGQLRALNAGYRNAAGQLEAANSELRAINEDLRGVNAELKAQFGRASHANAELQGAMEAAGAGALFLDGGLRIERFTPALPELTGIAPDVVGRPFAEFAEHIGCPALAGDALAVLNEHKIVERETGSSGRQYLTRLRPLRTVNGGGEGVICTFVDVTTHAKAADAVKASEARLRLLLGELSHRVKNTLAVVQSMARQSFRGDVSREDGLENFSNRLRALAEAHNVMANSDWRGADLRELASRQLNAYAKPDGKTVILDGPAVSIPPSLATPLALVLHELATNALKYGALSSPAGTLRLEWGSAQTTTGRVFQLTWRESGGPAVKPPPKEGFGSWLIQHGLPGAEVVLEYPPEGVACSITLPEESLKPE